MTVTTNADFTRNPIMFTPEAEFAYRAVLRAMPDFRFSRGGVERLLGTLPPPPADAPIEWWVARLIELMQEIRALGPLDVLEEMMVTQIIACRHAAMHSEQLALDPTVSAADRRGLLRSAETMLGTANSVQRALKGQRVRPAPQRPAPVTFTLDIAALEAAWLRAQSAAPVPAAKPVLVRAVDPAGVPGPRLAAGQPVGPAPVPASAPAPVPASALAIRPVTVAATKPATGPATDLAPVAASTTGTSRAVDPGGSPPGGSPREGSLPDGSAPPGAVPVQGAPRDTRQPTPASAAVEPVKYTICGVRIDLVRLNTMPPAGTA